MLVHGFVWTVLTESQSLSNSSKPDATVKFPRCIGCVRYIVYIVPSTGREREVKPKGRFLSSVKNVLVFVRFGSHSFLVASHIACFPHEVYGGWYLYLIFPTEYLVQG